MEAKQRLNSLFKAGVGSGSGSSSTSDASNDGNDALRYTAPKESARQRSSAPSSSASVATGNANAYAASQQQSSIIHSASVMLHKYDTTMRRYQPVGSGSIGCVILSGPVATYTLLFYNAQKEHLCQTILTPTFQCTLQKNAYVNFYDHLQNNYSIKFSSENDASAMLRMIALCRTHTGIWGTTKMATDRMLQQDLMLGKEGNGEIQHGDTVGVVFTAWRITGTVDSSPKDFTASTPIDSSTLNDLRKFRLGDGNEKWKALEQGVVGMVRGAKRLLVAPPSVTATSDWHLIEVELVKTKSSVSERKPSFSSTSSSTTATSQHSTPNSSTSSSTPKSIVPYEPLPGSPRAREHAAQKLKWEKEEFEMQKKALEEVKAKLMADQMHAQQQKIEELQHQQILQLQQQQLQFQQQQQSPLPPPSIQSGLAYTNALLQGLSQNASSPYTIGSTTSLNLPPHLASVAVGNGMTGTSNGVVEGGLLLLEMNAKLDHLIRASSTSTSTSTSSLVNRSFSHLGSSSLELGGLDSAASLARGVERLALDNERLARDMLESTQQSSLAQKRVDELLEKNRDLIMENHRIMERLSHAHVQSASFTTELALAKSAKETAETQLTRLSGEYQRASAMLSQQQQQQHLESKGMQEAVHERQARERVEAELKTATQARALAEQQLSLVQRQMDTDKKALLHEWESKVQQERTWANQKITELQTVVEKAKKHIQSLSRENEKWADYKVIAETAVGKVKQNEEANYELQRQLMEANENWKIAIQAANEAKLLTTQRSLDLAKIEELTTSHEAFIKRLMEQHKKELIDAAAHAKAEVLAEQEVKLTSLVDSQTMSSSQEDAERIFEEAKKLKEDAERMVLEATNAAAATGAAPSNDQVIDMFKDTMNEVYFRFQDVFVEEEELSGKEVLESIRKILKQSTKEVIGKLENEKAAEATPLTS